MDKVRENRLRRHAARLGLRLIKSRAQKYQQNNQGGYMIIDPEMKIPTQGVKFELSLDEVEAFLKQHEEELRGGK
ncbi:MAG: hypothetical protein SCJ94_11930 [Bacillota bacterium]|nr:hypothetical protein [Bacillota bacterium]